MLPAGFGAIGNIAAAVTPQQQVALDVAECDQGFYGAGGALNSVCTPCPVGTTTSDTGAQLISECNCKYTDRMNHNKHHSWYQWATDAAVFAMPNGCC